MSSRKSAPWLAICFLNISRFRILNQTALRTWRAVFLFMQKFFNWLKHRSAWLGIELDPVSTREKLISTLGGILGVAAVCLVGECFRSHPEQLLIIGSMAASAVLLFAVPQGALSQPWPLLGGHAISAIVGLICVNWLGAAWWVAALAVGLSIGAMHLAKCIHPPGGATALTAVFLGSSTDGLGWEFLLCPVLLNAVTLLIVAVGFNYFFAWRRYPAILNERARRRREASEITHEEVVQALRRIDSFVDITEENLVRIYEILRENHQSHREALGKPKS